MHNTWALKISCVTIAILLNSCTGGLPPDELPERGTVLIRMTSWQEPWFAKRVSSWQDRESVELRVESYQNIEDIPLLLKNQREPQAGGSHLLIKVEGRMLPTLIRDSLIIPIDSIVDDISLRKSIRAEFVPEALNPAIVDGTLWGLPRKVENHVFVARQGAVRDASLFWSSHREEIDAIFRFENGVGLPVDYSLPMNTELWDTYDLAVAGYYWSRTPQRGKTGPRLGHRTRDYPGTFVDHAARILALGGSVEEMIEGRGQALEDYLLWEAFFLRYGIYPREMIEPGWFGGDMYAAFDEGRLLATTVHQLDAMTFRQRFATEDPDDRDFLAISTAPRGVSLQLDTTSTPARQGYRRSHSAGWWWVIPAHCPSPRYALELARWITSREFHGEEAQQFGIYPVRVDMWENLESFFPSTWTQHLFQTSRIQFETGCPPIPDDRIQHRQAALQLLAMWNTMATHPRLDDLSIPLHELNFLESAR